MSSFADDNVCRGVRRTMQEPGAEAAQRVLDGGDGRGRRLHGVPVYGAQRVAVLVGTPPHDAAVAQQVVHNGGAVRCDLRGCLSARRRLRRARRHRRRQRHPEYLPAPTQTSTCHSREHLPAPTRTSFCHLRECLPAPAQT